MACSHGQLIQDREYRNSEKLFASHQYDHVLFAYPQWKEKNGFITSFEKIWISFWQDHQFISTTPLSETQQAHARVRIQELLHLVAQIEERKIIKISTETAVFLMGEAEDGYIPSEHEILILYLFTAMNYIDVQSPQEARIYLRKAADFFDGNPEGKKDKFDDPALRLWLASLWSQLGEFDFAEVNLRVAYQLQPNVQVRQWLSDHRNVVFGLQFNGHGAEPQWNSNGEFVGFRFDLVQIPFEDAAYRTESWYQWHLHRNTALREKLIKSNYMLNYLGLQSERGLKKTSAVLMSAPIYILSAAVLVGGVSLVVYAAAQSGGGASEGFGYLLAGVVALAKVFYNGASEVYDAINTTADRDYERQLAQLKIYRMFRFLPAAVSLKPSAQSWTWQKETGVFK